MKIQLYSIAKKERGAYETICSDLMKLSSRFSRIEIVDVFDNEVSKAQANSPKIAQEIYTKRFEAYLDKGYNVALHPDGVNVDSYEFSKLLSDRISITFYIGGAYGFEDRFVQRCDRAISLSPLTMSHKIAKVVLLEQIYRGFTILNNHPYHK